MGFREGTRTGAMVWLVGIVAAVAVIWLLRVASLVVIPVAIAFFIALIVYPVQVYVHRRTGRRWLAVTLTMGLIAAVVGSTVWAAAESIDEAAEAAPRYQERLQQVWGQVEAAAQGSDLPIPTNPLSSDNFRQRMGDLAARAARTAWEVASGLVLVFFLVLLMLLEAPVWGANTRRVMLDGHGRVALETVGEIASKVRRYLYVRTVLGLMSALAAGVWLFLLDIDLVLIWVVLTFLLNYIPNFGSIIAVFPPALMALLQHGPLRALLVLGGLAIIEQIIGNFIDPRMQGRRLQISPTVVLVALVFWTWMWGPVGALLAVPMTVTLLSAAQHVPSLRPFVVLLAAERDPAPARRDAA